MASPSLELQGAIVARLKASAGLTALISGRVYDAVPTFADKLTVELFGTVHQMVR